jgi:hypothetical protein
VLDDIGKTAGVKGVSVVHGSRLTHWRRRSVFYASRPGLSRFANASAAGLTRRSPGVEGIPAIHVPCRRQ